jgi:hypothetical protein
MGKLFRIWRLAVRIGAFTTRILIFQDKLNVLLFCGARFTGNCGWRSQYSMTRKSPGPQVGQNNFAPKPRSPTAVPWGYCFKCHCGQSCTGRALKHSCFKCQGNHRVSQCGNNFRGFYRKSPANIDRSAKSSTTNASKNSASN